MKNKLLFTAILFAITTNTFSQVPNYVPTNGLVAWYPFNGNGNDESGNGNHGIINGPSLANDRFGNSNSSFEFIESEVDHISMPSGANSALNITGNLTVNFWFKTISEPAALLAFNDNVFGTGGYGFSMGIFTPDRLAFFSNNNWFEVQANNQADNNWHFVSANFNLGNLDLYFDGVLVSSYSGVGAPTSWNSTRTLGIGNNPSGLQLNGIYYDGYLDDIGLWNRALTQCEIQDLYHSELNSLAVNGGPDQSLCEGQSITLNGSGASTYSWNNSVQNGVGFVPTATSSYTVIGTDVNGCFGTDTVSIIVNNNSYSILNETALDSYILNGQTYTQSGTYTQIIPNAAGCDSTITLNLTLNYTGITELKNGLRIYPNPTFDKLTIERTSSLNSNYVLVDSQGRLVLQGDLTETITHLSLGKLEYGNYMLQLENQSVPIRIVKQ